jgi:hypothetical protein
MANNFLLNKLINPEEVNRETVENIPSDWIKRLAEQYGGQLTKPDSFSAPIPQRMPAQVSPIEATKPMQEDIISSAPPITTPNELEQALAYQRRTQETSALNKAGSRLGAAIAGLGPKAVLTPSLGGAEDLEKLGEGRVKEILTKRKGKSDLLDLNNKEALGNPKSDISQFVRNAIQTKLKGVQIPEGMSASQVMEFSPLFRSMAEKEMSDYQRLVIESRIRGLELGEGREERLGEQFTFRKKQYGDLTPKQQETMVGYDKTITDLDKIEELKPAFDTGAIEGRVAKFRENIGLDDAGMSAYRARIGRMVSDYIRSISGLSTTDKERAELQANTIATTKSDETFLETLKQFREDVKRHRDVTLQGYKQYGGKDIDRMIEKNVGTGKQTEQAPSAQQDPKIKAWADKYGKTYEESEKTLRARGYGK